MRVGSVRGWFIVAAAAVPVLVCKVLPFLQGDCLGLLWVCRPIYPCMQCRVCLCFCACRRIALQQQPRYMLSAMSCTDAGHPMILVCLCARETVASYSAVAGWLQQRLLVGQGKCPSWAVSSAWLQPTAKESLPQHPLFMLLLLLFGRVFCGRCVLEEGWGAPDSESEWLGS